MLRAAASCAAILIVVFACGWPEDSADGVRRAQQALADGDLVGARAALRALPESAPESADELLELAELLLRANEAPRALWLLEAGVERFPERDDLKVALGRAALTVGNAVRARAAVDAIAPESAEHLRALLIRAHAQLALGDLEAALATLSTAEQRYPDSPEARMARIGTLLGERRLDEAAQVIENVRESATGDEAISLSLLAARVEVAQGDPAAAAARLSEAHDRHPDDVAVLDALVTAELQAERAQAALELVSAAIERDPEQAALHAIAARVHLQRGEFERAEQSLRRCADLSHSPAGYLHLARFYVDRGRPDAAVAANAAAVDRFPDETAPRVWLAESSIDRGDLDRAREELRALSRLAANDPQLAYLRARLDLAAGDAEAAAEQLRGLVSVLDRAHTQYWLGRALEASGDVEGAERRYGLALLRDGEHAAGAAELMRLAELRGDWSALAQHALASIRRAPAKDDAYPTAITALARTGRPDAAEALAREYARRFADRAVAYALLAFALRAQGRLDEAASELEAAEARFGEDPELLAERAALLAAQGRLDEGIRSLESATRLAPREARHHATLAALLFARGQREAGEAAVERALALDPDDLAPLELRSRYRAATGNLEGALDDCRRYLAHRPRNAGVRFTCAVVLEQIGDTERAIEAYRLAIANDERAFAARNNLALLLAAKGDLQGGLEVAQEAYGLAESNPEVIDTLGRLYRESGLPKRAVALLEKARAAGIDRPSSRHQLALAYEELGRAPGARGLSRKPAQAPDATPELRDALAARTPVNVVLVVVDTLRADWTTPYGGPERSSPELARWASRGAVFERVLAQSSWTKSSMASLMTSQWPGRVGVSATTDALGQGALTVAEVFQRAGYRTYAVQSNGWLEQTFGFHQGFDHYLFPRGGISLGARPMVWPHADNVYLEAERLIDSHDPSRPFFLYLHFMDVHEYAAPSDFTGFGSGDEGAYRAAIAWVDEVVARVRERLEDRGLLDRTAMVLASDHGEAFGENGVRGHARNVHAQVLRVPLVIRFPFPITPVRISARARNLDLAPTLLELAGLDVPEPFQGESLLPWVIDPAAASDRIAFASLPARLYANAVLQVGMNDGSWSFLRDTDEPGRERLFDRSVDPGENVNLALIEPERAQSLRARLDAYLVLPADPGGVESDIRINPGLAGKLRALGYGM